ncbi:GTP-binding protein [Nocardia sp. XZ_19_385]|uniref:GTP-binding protein n=1 Tax=Nocardia sp. XZ_19_385 TaxID=2769488 RepID=UPI00188E2AEE|nr:GTP-binding protein [Nocardia sp. XZ_19_385]
MGTKAVEPRAIRNVVLFGDLDGTTGLAQRLARLSGNRPAPAVIHWATDQVEHTIRVADVSDHPPERSIRVADGAIAVIDAATGSTSRLEAMLRAADDYQVARLCLITGLDRPGADFDRCVRRITDIRGAVPLPLQIPVGAGVAFDGVIDLIRMPASAEIPGSSWRIAEPWHRALIAAVGEQDTELTPERLHYRIRRLTRLGEVVPVLCGVSPGSDDLASLLDAVVRYLPSPMDVCQPEHALDY